MMYISESDQKYIDLERNPPQYFVDFADAAKCRYEKNAKWKYAASEYYTLIYLIAGRFSFGESEICVDPNEVLFIPKFSVPLFCVQEDSSFIKLLFNTSLNIPFLQSAKPFVFPSSFEMLSLYEKLYRASHFQMSFAGAQEAMLLNILNDIEANRTAGSTEVVLYEKALKWMESHAHKNITAEAVAAALGCSRAYLNRIVKSVDGTCLSEKIASFRLKQIKNLCCVENLTLAEIAERLDFFSPELLCKFFKYHTGISITDYRNAYR